MFALFLMSALLGISSFGFGVLPLSFAFSRIFLDHLSILGTGLLLGAALGVIIPEGIESVAASQPGSGLPTSSIALSLLSGFTLMLVIEQLVSPHSHTIPGHSGTADNHSGVEFYAELGDLEAEQGVTRSRQGATTRSVPASIPEGRERAFPLTFGLIIHGLADGLALGVSSLPASGTSSNLSFIVFLALIIHKAPTSLALTTSLLSTTLPRPDCKRHLAAFSLSTPVASIGSYLTFSFLGGADDSWTGIALLVSGGTFLYVATVLQPVSHHSEVTGAREMLPSVRVLLIVTGMFIPFMLSALLGHGH
ncbi:Zinc/iron permease [Infundibulicybe gibba]|nr:Zinc/iron permease [Infundibulicybe gibba]